MHAALCALPGGPVTAFTASFGPSTTAATDHAWCARTRPAGRLHPHPALASLEWRPDADRHCERSGADAAVLFFDALWRRGVASGDVVVDADRSRHGRAREVGPPARQPALRTAQRAGDAARKPQQLLQ